MKFGLTELEYSLLEEKLFSSLKSKGLKIFIFGSRATGQFHRYSDIDILVSGAIDKELETKILLIKEFFEESNFPYKIDLVPELQLADSYKKNVDQTKVEV